MLNNFKKKLTNVIQEGKTFSENLQNIKLPSVPLVHRETPVEIGFPTNLNPTAGCQLLKKYENSWELLHHANLENVNLAEEADLKILKVRHKIKDVSTDLSDMNTCLSGVPTIRKNLQICVEKMNEIRKLCETVELALVGLEDITEQCDMQEKQLDEKFQLSLYKQRKMSGLEAYRQTLATKHQQNIQECEDKLKRMQKERQAVFEDAFQSDLEEYKRNGNIPRISQPNIVDRGPTLEEVDLDDAGNNDLENFLNG